MDNKYKNKKYDRNRDRIYLISGLVMLCILTYGLYYFKHKPRAISFCACIVFLLFFVVVEIWGIKQYYEQYIKPERESKPLILSWEEKRKKSIYGRIKANDMYEVCRTYSREFHQARGLLIGLALALMLVFYLFLSDINDNPYWISVILAFVVVILLMLAILIDSFKYKSVDDLKTAVENSGFDSDRVNNDFMLGTYHRLATGLLTIGRNYYVIYDKTACYVGAINDINKVFGGKIVERVKTGLIGTDSYERYLIKIKIDRGTITLQFWDYIELKYAMDEFSKLGLETEYNKDFSR